MPAPEVPPVGAVSISDGAGRRLGLRAPKDFWAGLIFVAFGAGFLIVGRDYEIGRATKMGPGYFPLLLAALLTLVGIAVMVRALRVPGTPVRGFAVVPLMLILVAGVIFGYLLRRAGLLVAVVPLALISAAASIHFRWQVALMLAVALAIFCSMLFVVGLGLPIPIVGPWLGG